MKKYQSIAVILLSIMILCACGKTDEGLTNHPEFVGRWQCAEAPLENPDYYTGYLMWMVNEDGSFSMYDAEAGNPGITGKMQIISEKELQLECDLEEDFDPPVTWENMEGNQTFTYEFVGDKEIRVTFTSEGGQSTLVFFGAE